MGVDHHLTPLGVALQGDDLEQRTISARAEIQAEVVLELLDRDGVADRVLDVLGPDALLEGRRVAIPTPESYYETSRKGMGVSVPTSTSLRV